MEIIEAARCPVEPQIIAEVVMEFSENSEIGEGLCSCVCISDESCCGCIVQ
jgi:hypothetical protein